MKRIGAWFILALFAMSVPLGGAQETDEFPQTVTEGELEWVLIGTDEEDDNNYNQGSAAEVDSANPATDVRALYVAEGVKGEILFRIHVTELPDSASCTGAICDHSYNLDFKLWEYDMSLDITDRAGNDEVTGSNLYANMWLRHETENSYRSEYLGNVPASRNDAGSFYEAIMERDLVSSPSGSLLQAGDELHSFRGYSFYQDEATVATFGLARSQDWFPDEGTFPTKYTTTFGVTSVGHLDVFSPLPLRTSNGEATTFFFEVEVTSNADFFDTVHPEWSGGLDAWTVTFPDGPVRLEPGESRSLPFLVTVPFSHEHGAYHPFTVSFQSQADPESRGNIELGIRYTNIPQPAGHHPEVFLHDPEGRAFFNTVDDLETFEGEDSATEGSSGYCSSGSGQGMAVPMSPSLSMGLDFNLEEQGEATWLITADRDTDGIVYSGAFVVSATEPNDCDIARGDVPRDAVAIIAPHEPTSVTGGTTVEVKAPINATEFGDYVPFDENNQLWLLIRRTIEDDAQVICCPDDFVFEASLADGTKFFLPLNEYHDDVDDYFADLSGIDLYVENNTQERFVNPGETIIFNVEATNVGALRAEFDLELTGSNVEWAQLLGTEESLRLDPGEIRDLAVAVRAPSADFTADEEFADLVLHATLVEDESIRSIIRLIAEVDTDEDHPDQTAAVTGVDAELQESPAIAAPLLLAGLAGLVLRARRR